MRTIFIGDVHGCIDELKELIAKIDPKKEDRVIFLGDIINKGPDSVGVVKFVCENGYECVCGNHELHYRNRFDTHPRYQSIRSGLTLEEHDWLASLPAFIEDTRFIAVHAGLIPRKLLSESDHYTLCNIRTWNEERSAIGEKCDPAWHSFHSGDKPVFYGHWAAQRLSLGKNGTFGLDDGCVYGGNLCAYVLETGELIRVPAKRIYQHASKRRDFLFVMRCIWQNIWKNVHP